MSNTTSKDLVFVLNYIAVMITRAWVHFEEVGGPKSLSSRRVQTQKMKKMLTHPHTGGGPPGACNHQCSATRYTPETSLVNEANLVHVFLSIFINLYMFQANMCPSLGETTVFMRHLVLPGLQGGMKQFHSTLHT